MRHWGGGGGASKAPMLIAEHLILILLLTFSGNTRSGSMRPETRCVSTPWRRSAPYESNPTLQWTPTGITTTPCVSHSLPTITFSPCVLQYVISACRILSIIRRRNNASFLQLQYFWTCSCVLVTFSMLLTETSKAPKS